MTRLKTVAKGFVRRTIDWLGFSESARERSLARSAVVLELLQIRRDARQIASNWQDGYHRLNKDCANRFADAVREMSPSVTQASLGTEDAVMRPWRAQYLQWQTQFQGKAALTRAELPDLGEIAEAKARKVVIGPRGATDDLRPFFEFYTRRQAETRDLRAAAHHAKSELLADLQARQARIRTFIANGVGPSGDPLLEKLEKLPEADRLALVPLLTKQFDRCERRVREANIAIRQYPSGPSFQTRAQAALASIFQERLSETLTLFDGIYLAHTVRDDHQDRWNDAYARLTDNLGATFNVLDLSRRNFDHHLFRERVRGLFDLQVAAKQQDTLELAICRRQTLDPLNAWVRHKPEARQNRASSRPQICDLKDRFGHVQERPSNGTPDPEQTEETPRTHLTASFLDWVPLPQRLAFLSGEEAKGELTLELSGEEVADDVVCDALAAFVTGIAGTKTESHQDGLLLSAAAVRDSERVRHWSEEIQKQSGLKVLRNWLAGTNLATGYARIRIAYDRGVLLTCFWFGTAETSDANLSTAQRDLLHPETLRHVALAAKQITRLALSAPMQEAGSADLTDDGSPIVVASTTLLPTEIEPQALDASCGRALSSRAVLREADQTRRDNDQTGAESLVARYGRVIDEHLPHLGKTPDSSASSAHRKKPEIQVTIERAQRWTSRSGYILVGLFFLLLFLSPTHDAAGFSEERAFAFCNLFFLLACWRCLAAYNMGARLDPDRGRWPVQGAMDWVFGMPYAGLIRAFVPAAVLIGAWLAMYRGGVLDEGSELASLFRYILDCVADSPFSAVAGGLMWALPAIGFGLLAHAGAHFSTVLAEAYDGPEDQKILMQLTQLCPMAQNCARELSERVYDGSRLAAVSLEPAKAAIESAATRVTERFDRWRSRSLRRAAVWVGVVSGLAILGPLNSFRPETTDVVDLLFGEEQRAVERLADKGETDWILASLEGGWFPTNTGQVPAHDASSKNLECVARLRARLADTEVSRAPRDVQYAILHKGLKECDSGAIALYIASLTNLIRSGGGAAVPFCGDERANLVADRKSSSQKDAQSRQELDCVPREGVLTLKLQVQLNETVYDLTEQANIGALRTAVKELLPELPLLANIGQVQVGLREPRALDQADVGEVLQEEISKAAPDIQVGVTLGVKPADPKFSTDVEFFKGQKSDPLWLVRQQIAKAAPIKLEGELSLTGGGTVPGTAEICGTPYGIPWRAKKVADLRFATARPRPEDTSQNAVSWIDGYGEFAKKRDARKGTALSPGSSWHVVGYASSFGSDVYNKRLAARRAAFTAALWEQGLGEGADVRWSGGGEYRLRFKQSGATLPAHADSQVAEVYLCQRPD